MAIEIVVLLGGVELILGPGAFTVLHLHQTDVPLFWKELATSHPSRVMELESRCHNGVACLRWTMPPSHWICSFPVFFLKPSRANQYFPMKYQVHHKKVKFKRPWTTVLASDHPKAAISSIP
eukprot:1149997-Pelagomonas_calceolata.AAC.1